MAAPTPLTGSSSCLDTVIVWFRRDLRVEDNPALIAALQTAKHVIPVYIWSPEEEGQFQPGRCSRWWFKQTLDKFQQQLQSLGSRLILRRADDSSKALLQLVQETGAQALFFNHLYDPISLVRDHEVKQNLAMAGISCRSYNADLLYEPWEIVDKDETPFTNFDDFWMKVVNMPYPPPFPLPAPSVLPPVKSSIHTLTLSEIDFFMTPEQEASSEQLGFKWQPGVSGAMDKLQAFLDGRLKVFEHDRAKVDRDSTSQLSPWVHCGSISVRLIYYKVRQQQQEWLAVGEDRIKSCLDFLQQMGYREYSRYLSFHFPFIHERALLAHLRAVPWKIDSRAFKCWKQGMTGYPIIDAGMKQLWSTGWVHNRLRVVAASFMVKHLLLPWQWGLKHYWDSLMDADLECDALGWQYVSGCMADAHPFSYMIDLEAESARFDPDGEFVRRWLPALARLPTQYIHAPWKAPEEILIEADVELGLNYPYPLVEVEESRKLLDNAACVIDKCAISDGSARQPYRPATDAALHLAATAGRSPGQLPDGCMEDGGFVVNSPRDEEEGSGVLGSPGGNGEEDSYSSDEMDAVSEEVVSNTMCISAMPTQWSGMHRAPKRPFTAMAAPVSVTGSVGDPVSKQQPASTRPSTAEVRDSNFRDSSGADTNAHIGKSGTPVRSGSGGPVSEGSLDECLDDYPVEDDGHERKRLETSVHGKEKLQAV